jgi:hypothetical protein
MQGDETITLGKPMFDRLSKFAILLPQIFFFLLAAHAHGQAAMLMEEPYGLFGSLNPTGHTAFYFERICAETPVRVRRCQAGEMGAVISRYQGISGYDWVAIPLIPYLYAVNNASDAPEHTDRATVKHLRSRYHESHLLDLGEDLQPGDFFHGGWSQLIGLAYERRIYAFRFMTSEEQDDALIAKLNGSPNTSHFSLLYNNCADYARGILNFYYPGTFKRSIFPDAGMTTPKQIARKLTRMNHKHAEMQLKVFEIPQIPGYRHSSHANKNISESLMTSAYAVPITLSNPWLAGGIAVDYLLRGRYHTVPRHPLVLEPRSIEALNVQPLTTPGITAENPASATVQVSGAEREAVDTPSEMTPLHSGLMEY